MSAFIPPFCPWKGSSEHHLPSSKHPYQAYLPWGSYPTKSFGRVPRFRCSSCESLIRASGRKLGLSCDSVSNRISRANRQTIAAESRLASSRHPDEDLAAEAPDVRGGLSGWSPGEGRGAGPRDENRDLVSDSRCAEPSEGSPPRATT